MPSGRWSTALAGRGGEHDVVVSVILAFLSGMEMKRSVVTNLVIIAAAVGITFAIGLVTKLVWGVSV